LLFTIDAKDIDRLKTEYVARFSEKISVIGEIKEGQTGISWFKKGENISNNKDGFNHFTKSK